MPAINITPEFGYPIAVALSSYIVNQYMAVGVMAARKKFNVKYPTLYATEADSKEWKKFNCVQRGHQNFLENYPTYLMLQGLSALVNPVYSAVLGGLYLAGRVLYFRGYSSGNPEGRMQGAIQYIGLFGMLGMAGKLSFDLIRAALKA